MSLLIVEVNIVSPTALLRSMVLLHFLATVNVPISRSGTSLERTDHGGDSRTRAVICFASKQRQGFGPEPKKKDKTSTAKSRSSSTERKRRKFQPAQPMTSTGQAPGLGRDSENKAIDNLSDRQFMNRLEAVKRSSIEQKKVEENMFTQAIDYDAPIKSEKSTIGLATRVGVGVAVVVFGLVFALGDFFPSESLKSNDEVVENKLTDEEKASLQTRLQEYEATLSSSPEDSEALEGAAVTSAGLGEYKQASLLLEKLTKERPEDYEAYRLLGEVKYQLKDYEGSAAAYKNSLSASPDNFDALRGLTNVLLAAKKPEEAVRVLLSSAQRLNIEDVDVNGKLDKEMSKIDPIQVQLLLGKAYSDWGHVSDAVSVYDQLISKYPEDFRGYLAKGIILKGNNRLGEAERMFIQARFFAPDEGKMLVDRYSRR